MTDYLILIYGDENRWGALGEDGRAAVDAAHGAFWQTAGEQIRASGELQASSTATTLRTGQDGEPKTTDGPFAEAKEVVGGFYVVQAESQDAAVTLAGTLAEARQGHGGIEVRPLVSRG
jgi:hypothetical protein